MQAFSCSTAPASPRATPSSPVLPQRASLGSVRPWAVARARRPIRCCTRDPGNYRCSQLLCAPPSTSMAHSKLLENGPVPSEVAWPAQPDSHVLVCSCTRSLRCVCWRSRCFGCIYCTPRAATWLVRRDSRAGPCVDPVVWLAASLSGGVFGFLLRDSAPGTRRGARPAREVLLSIALCFLCTRACTGHEVVKLPGCPARIVTLP